MSRYTHEETEAKSRARLYGPFTTEEEAEASLRDDQSPLIGRQDRIQERLHQVRKSLDDLEGMLRPVLTEEVSVASVDKPGVIEESSNLAVYLAETAVQLGSLVDHIERLVRRVDL